MASLPGWYALFWFASFHPWLHSVEIYKFLFLLIRAEHLELFLTLPELVRKVIYVFCISSLNLINQFYEFCIQTSFHSLWFFVFFRRWFKQLETSFLNLIIGLRSDCIQIFTVLFHGIHSINLADLALERLFVNRRGRLDIWWWLYEICRLFDNNGLFLNKVPSLLKFSIDIFIWLCCWQ